MEYTIKSRKLNRKITFSRPSSHYIYVDLNNHSGTLSHQICKGGELSGSPLGISGNKYDSQVQKRFERLCKSWWKQYRARFDADDAY